MPLWGPYSSGCPTRRKGRSSMRDREDALIKVALGGFFDELMKVAASAIKAPGVAPGAPAVNAAGAPRAPFTGAPRVPVPGVPGTKKALKTKTAAPAPKPAAPTPTTAPAAPTRPKPAPKKDPLAALKAMKTDLPSSSPFGATKKRPGMKNIMSRKPAQPNPLAGGTAPRATSVGRGQQLGEGKIPIAKQTTPTGPSQVAQQEATEVQWQPGQPLPAAVTRGGARQGGAASWNLASRKGESQEAYNKRLKAFQSRLKQWGKGRQQEMGFSEEDVAPAGR